MVPVVSWNQNAQLTEKYRPQIASCCPKVTNMFLKCAILLLIKAKRLYFTLYL